MGDQAELVNVSKAFVMLDLDQKKYITFSECMYVWVAYGGSKHIASSAHSKLGSAVVSKVGAAASSLQFSKRCQHIKSH